MDNSEDVAKQAGLAGPSPVPREVSSIPPLVSSTPSEQSQSAPTQAERAKEVAGTAVSGAGQVAQDAKQQAAQVAHEASEQLGGLLHGVRGDLRSQAEQQTSRAGETLRRLSSQLGALRSGDMQGAGPVVGYVEQVQTKVHALAQRIDDRGFDGVATDLRDVARRRPAAFLLGAAAAGFLAGRLLRASTSSGPEPVGEAPSAGLLERQETPIAAELTNPLAMPVDAAVTPVGPVTVTDLSDAPTGEFR